MSETAVQVTDENLAADQKAKAIEFLHKLGIYAPYIKGFERSDKVCFFERFGGYWVEQEPEIENKMREIEKEHDCKVYAITHEKIDGDDMWSFLIVTAHRKEWDSLLMRDGNGFYAFSYTWNKNCDYCSEFGDVFVQNFGGGIRRVA